MRCTVKVSASAIEWQKANVTDFVFDLDNYVQPENVQTTGWAGQVWDNSQAPRNPNPGQVAFTAPTEEVIAEYDIYYSFNSDGKLVAESVSDEQIESKEHTYVALNSGNETRVRVTRVTLILNRKRGNDGSGKPSATEFEVIILNQHYFDKYSLDNNNKIEKGNRQIDSGTGWGDPKTTQTRDAHRETFTISVDIKKCTKDANENCK
jgi:hypothetical protein